MSLYAARLVIAAMIASMACSVVLADILVGSTRHSIDGDDVNELLRKVVGHEEPFWQYWADEWIYQDKRINRRVVLIHHPYRSSDEFCRTYETVINVPGWVCEENQCPEKNASTFDVKTRAFLAIVTDSDNHPNCTEYDFKNRFFALESDLHDRQVSDLLKKFRDYLEQWRESDDLLVKEVGEGLSEGNLASVEVRRRRGGEPLARFLLRHPHHDSIRLAFDLEFEGHDVIGYKMSQMLP